MSEEKTLFRGSSSAIVNLGTFLGCGLILAACIVFGFMVPLPAAYGLLGLGVVTFLLMIGRWLLIKVRVYEVTTERIRVTNGLLTRRTDELELYRVKDATLFEPIFMRMLGLGTIQITTNDASTPLLRLEAIKGARPLREELRKSIEDCRDRKRVRLAELE